MLHLFPLARHCHTVEYKHKNFLLVCDNKSFGYHQSVIRHRLFNRQQNTTSQIFFVQNTLVLVKASCRPRKFIMKSSSSSFNSSYKKHEIKCLSPKLQIIFAVPRIFWRISFHQTTTELSTHSKLTPSLIKIAPLYILKAQCSRGAMRFDHLHNTLTLLSRSNVT